MSGSENDRLRKRVVQLEDNQKELAEALVLLGEIVNEVSKAHNVLQGRLISTGVVTAGTV